MKYYDYNWKKMIKVKDLFYLEQSLFKSVDKYDRDFWDMYHCYVPTNICTICKELPKRQKKKLLHSTEVDDKNQ